MRLFELLTFLFILPLLIRPLLPWQLPPWFNGLPVLATIIHLIIEGYRWQMLLGYGLTLILVCLAIYQLWRGSPKEQTSLFRSIVGVVPGLLIWGIALVLPIAIPVPRLLSPTGPYAIGTVTYHLVDESRDEIYTPDPNDRRELMVQVWYPADVGTEATPARYMDALEVAGPVLAEQFDLPVFLFDHINLAQTGAYQDVPLANEAAVYPVIIFSHGLTGIRVQNTTMVHELVSHGFVVAAIDHTYANALSVFPDGRVILYDPARLFTNGEANAAEGNRLVQTWADDFAFLLAEMAGWQEDEDHLLSGRLDLSRLGLFGHSTGGGAVLEFCGRDGRCQAGVGLDSWVLPVSEPIVASGFSQPFMFISTPQWLGDENAARGRSIFANLSQDGYQLTLANTEHFDFTDLPLFSPLTPQLGLSGTIDSRYSLRIQTEYILAFFNQYLKGEQGASLLQKTSPYPELQINIHERQDQ